MAELTHLDPKGRVHMVDVGSKPETERVARARCRVELGPEASSALREGRAAKGDAMAAARIAGIMAAKRVDELIPLCHSLPITHAKVDMALKEDALEITSEVRTVARTGVEMEAMTAAAVAALTIYDMLKAAERGIRITDLALVYKSGGKSGTYEVPQE